jgi:hypothetical protein
MSSKVLVSIRVPIDPLAAFDAFTGEIGSWWRSNGLFAVTAEGDGSLVFEPHAGGRLWTTLASGAQFEIGRISAWEPGTRLVFSWRQASFAPEQSTEVEVRFEGVGEETRISVEHRASSIERGIRSRKVMSHAMDSPSIPRCNTLPAGGEHL